MAAVYVSYQAIKNVPDGYPTWVTYGMTVTHAKCQKYYNH